MATAASAGAQTRNTVTSGTLPPAGQPAPAGAPGAPGTGTGNTVNPVTVQPQVTPQGRVVSSTDATSITSPNYSPDDAAPPPRAVSLGGNAAAGVQTVTPSPPSGLPASMDPGPKRSEIGVTTVF
jgi:hypothetical protein